MSPIKKGQGQSPFRGRKGHKAPREKHSTSKRNAKEIKEKRPLFLNSKIIHKKELKGEGFSRKAFSLSPSTKGKAELIRARCATCTRKRAHGAQRAHNIDYVCN